MEKLKVLNGFVGIDSSIVPDKLWFNLKECCSLKGINYKTVCNRKYLQPNKGLPEGYIGGRKCFRRSTLLIWLLLTDEEICKE